MFIYLFNRTHRKTEHQISDFSMGTSFFCERWKSISPCNVLVFCFHELPSATWSSLAGKTITFANEFGSFFILKHDPQQIVGRIVLFLKITYSKLLFDVAAENRCTLETPLIVNIAAVWEASPQWILYSIVLTDRTYKIAVLLTEIVIRLLLEKFMTTKYLNHLVRKNLFDSPIHLC